MQPITRNDCLPYGKSAQPLRLAEICWKHACHVQLGAQQWQSQAILRGNPGLMGTNPLANQLGVQNLMPQQGFQGTYGQPGPYIQGHPLVHQQQPLQIADEAFNGAIEERYFVFQISSFKSHHGPLNTKCVQHSPCLANLLSLMFTEFPENRLLNARQLLRIALFVLWTCLLPLPWQHP